MNMTIVGCAITWVICTAIIIYKCFGHEKRTVGLPIAFFMEMYLTYFIGAAVYLLPWHHGVDADYVLLGFTQATFGVVLFVAGYTIISPLVNSIFGVIRNQGVDPIPIAGLIKFYISVGIIFHFLLANILEKIPSFRTFSGIGWNMIFVGMCLAIRSAYMANDKKKMYYLLALVALTPLYTTVVRGFMMVGTIITIIVFSFVMSFYKPRWKMVLVLVLGGYLGLSLFINYMVNRVDIREQVWKGGSANKRVMAVSNMFSEFKFIDLYDSRHLLFIGERLNQSPLIGRSVERIENGTESYLAGGSILDAILAPIPRILWPDKPIEMGGSEIVSRYSGLEFASGTSVAVCPVMELYINFGTLGVIIGYLIFGTIVGLLDLVCSNMLERSDYQGFVFWFLPSMALFGAESIGAITMTAAASIVFCMVVHKLVSYYFYKKER